MTDQSRLLAEYEKIRDQPNRLKRGHDFEGFIGRVFGSYHFSVERNARAASPRQVDLLAQRDAEVYLIETKWRQAKSDIDAVDSLYTRLEALPANVTGLLVSHAGFTKAVIGRVREKSSRPVILVSGKEIEQCLRRDYDFLDMLRRKVKALLVHREVQLDLDIQGSRTGPHARTDASNLPLGNRIFVWPDGSRSHMISCDGTFHPFTFVTELQDIDWTAGGGVGVTIDLRLAVQSQEDFVRLLSQMALMGWVTPKGCWSIQQSTAVWHGFGAGALVDALRDWSDRYDGLEVHHTEEMCYADECEDGFYSLVAQFSADDRRVVWQAELSFQLRGVPLDAAHYRELGEKFGLSEPAYFRPRSTPSLTRGRPPKTPALRKMTPLAYVVDVDGLMSDDDSDWAAGVVVQNPFFGKDRANESPEWVPDMAGASAFLVCALGSWHQLSNPKSPYELLAFESAWTSDALVVRPVADWCDAEDEDESRIATPSEGLETAG